MGFCTSCGAFFDRAPVRADPGSMPDDPVEAGRVYMDMGRFDEGMASWKDAIRAGPVPDDAVYSRMVESAAGCMLSIVMQGDMYGRAGVPEFVSMIPGRDFLGDMMSKLSGSLGVCAIQNGVLGLANSYCLLYLDCFRVHTDLRVLASVCSRACDALGAMCDRAAGLPAAAQPKGPDPMEWLSSYRDFTVRMRDAVDGMMGSVTEERIAELASRWGSTDRPYASLVQSAFALNAQATAAGRFSSRVFVKSRDAQISAFEKRYMRG